MQLGYLHFPINLFLSDLIVATSNSFLIAKCLNALLKVLTSGNDAPTSILEFLRSCVNPIPKKHFLSQNCYHIITHPINMIFRIE
jgi:hypothetical protein